MRAEISTRSSGLLAFGARARPRSPLFPYTTLFRSPPISTPGIFVLTAPTMLRNSAGADIFGSNVSMCVGPPPSHSQTTEVLRSEEHTSELQSLRHLVCRLLLEKKNDVSVATRAARG